MGIRFRNSVKFSSSHSAHCRRVTGKGACARKRPNSFAASVLRRLSSALHSAFSLSLKAWPDAERPPVARPHAGAHARRPPVARPPGELWVGAASRTLRCFRDLLADAKESWLRLLIGVRVLSEQAAVSEPGRGRETTPTCFAPGQPTAMAGSDTILRLS